MKAITLYQPYANLIAEGLKKYETRSWPTKYRGPIAIHASVRSVRWYEQNPDAAKVVAELLNGRTIADLPTGKIVAVGFLKDCIKMTPDFMATQTQQELAVGGWEPGRYAWEIVDVVQLPEPLEAKGKQGLWSLDDLCPACRYNTNDVVAHPNCGGCDGIKKFERRKKT